MATILEKTKEYVLNTLNQELPHGYLYHNYNHTQRVVKHVHELIEAEHIDTNDAEILELAAWFHDIGYIQTRKNHEREGAEMAEKFLKNENYPDDKIQTVKSCILATAFNASPSTQLEKIIADADFSHFASTNYDEISDLLREELRLLNFKEYSDEEWLEENIKMFKEHHKFHTQHAIEFWQPQKSKNLLKLIKSLRKLRGKLEAERLKALEKKQKKNKSGVPERGIETMFRVAMRNHINLSSIADTKANILLSVNAIIISLALSNLIPKLDNPSNAYLIYPTVIFVCFSVVSMVLSIIATRPKITSGEFTKQDVIDRKANLLFFGNFYKMDLEEYQWGMNEIMNDKDYLYDSLSKDLYFLGKVLERKYRILRITYSIFMLGIIISVLAFGISFKAAGF
ncbi:HDIG domain-containing protein [Zhouia amylolytica]|uniref:HD/PDEase domain-containing protein n=2 Tax=Zhouia amylolytica TaxID=376730 RepID=W2UK37_9FLAO|nr:Pycsar system effector family protein [Zhouia amylolytica]ETN93801.1 hypothetical protein P278_32110 [Zhouia amylolytica AD3]MCQ0111752.1 HD domain-containing protein [Zhouia amylolytica]SFS35181.1 HDIG domain-containing protein [Zhouia amylolytica]